VICGPSVFQLFGKHLNRLAAVSPTSAISAPLVPNHQDRRESYQNRAYQARASFSIAQIAAS
jgi:hypothetical protein